MIGDVVSFDYPYMRQNRKRPDRLPELVMAHRQALSEARKGAGRAVVLIGKSMGGRIGCHVALEERVNGLICLGYPLCAAGDRNKLRDQVLRALRSPVLFVQGTRDPLCPLDILADVRSGMAAANVLYVVEGADHSLAVSKRQLEASGETQAAVDQRILDVIAQFVEANVIKKR
jgi:uncharacterized protein